MRERLARFMQGRYGVDQFSNFLTVAALFLLVIAFFIPVPRMRSGMNSLAVLVFAYSYYRILSRNHGRRYAEYQSFLKYSRQFRYYFQKKKSRMQQRRTHKIFRCPSCRQAIRIPRGKGKIAITCPKCHTEFIRRS